MNELVEQDKQHPTPTVSQVNPMSLMQVAVESNADIDKLEKLMALQERWEAGNAKKSFYAALSDFQRKCPEIKKLKKGHNYMYAPLGDIIAQIKDLLADCGLSVRFEQDHSSGIAVTCVVSHKDGHSERNSMTGGADTSGSKNSIQAVGSTVTYLQRYTLTGALGITTADADIDGRLPQDKSVNINAPKEIIKIINGRGQSESDFFEWASRLLKKPVASFDDMSEDQIQWFLKKLESKQ